MQRPVVPREKLSSNINPNPFHGQLAVVHIANLLVVIAASPLVDIKNSPAWHNVHFTFLVQLYQVQYLLFFCMYIQYTHVPAYRRTQPVTISVFKECFKSVKYE
jgi:hypothetical protein